MPRLRPRGRRRSVRTYRGRYKTARLRRTPAGLRRTPAGFTTPPLMAVDFAASCPLVRLGRPRYPVRVPRVAALLHASFRPRLAATPLRFANPSPPSGWVEDLHLQAAGHARHTRERPSHEGRPEEKAAHEGRPELQTRDMRSPPRIAAGPASGKAGARARGSRRASPGRSG